VLWERDADFTHATLTGRPRHHEKEVTPVPKLTTQPDRPDATRDEVVRALLQPDRAQHDELGRTLSFGMDDDGESHSSPREQAAAPIDLHNVDE
jgi:hypothetical protein